MISPKRIVIVGGGTAGWIAANLFASKLDQKTTDITLIESPNVGIIGVGEGSTPTLKRFFDELGIAERDWMPKCNATYKTNIRFEGWSPEKGPSSYSHPFISQVDTFSERAFFVNTRTRRHGLDTHVAPEDFLLNGWLAKLQLAPITPPNFPFRMEYGYHFDSHLLGQFLAEHGVSLGVTHISDDVVDVSCHDNGELASVVTKDNGIVEGDLFVDCTGFHQVLMGETLGVKFQSFNDNLFNNAAVVIPTPRGEQLPVETRSVALSNGWCWHIPLVNRTGNGYVYSDDFTTSEKAEMELRQHLKVADDVEARHLKMRVGQVEQHWVKNCVAIGLSQGFIEPLEATALHLVQIGVELFISQWQSGGYTNQQQVEYNRLIAERFERVRDYIVAHYKLNTRTDSEYWRANRENEHLSDSLVNILKVWFARGEVEKEIERQQLESHFGSTSWHCLLSGYGHYPQMHPNQPRQGDLYKEQKIASFMKGCAMNFSDHESTLANLVASKTV